MLLMEEEVIQKMILKKMNGGKLFAFDQDHDSIKNSKS